MLSSYSYDSSSLFQSHEEYQDLTFCYTFDQDPINVNPFSFENLCDVKPLSSNNGPFANTDKPIKMDVQKQNIEPETSKNDNSIEKLSFEDLILMNEMHSLNNCLLGDTDNEPEDLPDSLLVDESSNLHKENLDLLKKQVDTLFHLKLKMYELSNQIKNDCDIKSINSIFEKKMNKIDQMEELWIKKWKKISGQKEFKNNELYKSEQLITVIQSKFVKLRKSLQSKILESLNSVNIVEPFKKPLKRKQKTNDSIININKKDFSLKNKCQKPKTAENMTVIKSRGKKRIERSTINQKIKIFRPPSIKRKRLNKGATKYLDDWFQKAMSSVNGPYANHRTKLYLSQQTGFSVRQVTNYLGNQRKKFRKTLDKDQISKFDWTSILENLDVHNLSPIEEKNLIKLFESQSSQLVQGAKWYLIDSVFYVKWRSYVGYDLKENEKNTSNSPKPDMIDNSALVNAKGKLKPGLSDYHHYNLVSELVWKALHKIYGGGPIIFRKVITCGIKKNMIVEIYPLNLKVHLEGKGKSVDITISKSETIEKIVQVACKEFKIKTEEVKLFDYYFLQIGKEYSIKTKQISDSYITNNNDLLLRTKESIENQKNNIDLESTDYLKTLINKPKHRGLTGLSNLGNTCFMNSGIQCLLNTIPLITYFLQGNYLTEINEKNPIGMGGKMANAFAEVCLEYWGGKSSVYSPREFKHVIGQFANQFTGYNQHDVQELISFVLDGIHEDLNRIKDKPYLENPETENKTDIQIGKEYWWNFKARNNSIITDLFHGQLRSKLTCPKCKKSTTKFDPFSSLSLPIPPPKEIELKITVIYKNGKLKPQVFGVKVERSLGIQGLYIELSKLTSIDPNNFLIGEVYNHKIYQKYGKTKDLGKIKQNDTIIAWEIDNDQNKEKLNNNNKKKPIILKTRKKRNGNGNGKGKGKGKGKEVDNQTGNGNDIETEKENDNESYSFISETDDYSDYYNEEDYSNSYGSSDYEIYGGGEANWETESESDYDNLESSDIDDMIYSKHGFYKYVFRPFFKITKINRLYSFGNVLKEDETVNVDEWDSFEVTFNPNLQKDDEIKEEKVINHTEQLAVANLHQSYKQMAKNLSKKIEQLDILKCLEKFLSEEILSEKDKWYCSKCKEQVQAIKKFDLWKLPEVLIIHLKRISYGTIFREKIDTLINFPEILNLEQYKINKKSNSKPSNLDYQLYAVSNHYGYYGGGHYTAYAQNPSTQDWYEYDDSTVSSIDSVKNSITRNAYLLFYHRKNEYAKYIKALPEEIEDFKNN